MRLKFAKYLDPENKFGTNSPDANGKVLDKTFCSKSTRVLSVKLEEITFLLNEVIRTECTLSRFPWKFSAFGNLSLSQGFIQVGGWELGEIIDLIAVKYT